MIAVFIHSREKYDWVCFYWCIDWSCIEWSEILIISCKIHQKWQSWAVSRKGKLTVCCSWVSFLLVCAQKHGHCWVRHMETLQKPKKPIESNYHYWAILVQKRLLKNLRWVMWTCTPWSWGRPLWKYQWIRRAEEGKIYSKLKVVMLVGKWWNICVNEHTARLYKEHNQNKSEDTYMRVIIYVRGRQVKKRLYNCGTHFLNGELLKH